MYLQFLPGKCPHEHAIFAFLGSVLEVRMILDQAVYNNSVMITYQRGY